MTKNWTSLLYHEKYLPPERLIPQGWLPEGWAPTDPKVNVPPGVQYFTPEDALMVAHLCPNNFPGQRPLSAGTAFFALTRIASTNRMVVTRLRNDEKRIIAVAMLAKCERLVHADEVLSAWDRHVSLVLDSAVARDEEHYALMRVRAELMRLLWSICD